MENHDFSEVQLINFLHYRAATCERATKRSQHVFGRLYNFMANEPPNLVTMNGRRVISVYKTFGHDEKAEAIDHNRDYQFPYQEVQGWVQDLVKIYKTENPESVIERR